MFKSLLRKIYPNAHAAILAEAQLEPEIEVEPLTPEKLAEFSIFSHLGRSELLVFSSKLELKTLQPGEDLFCFDDNDALEYLLVSGALRLTSRDLVERVITAGTKAASRVISGLKPRQYTATALSPCALIALDPAIHAHLAQHQSTFERTTVEEVESLDYHFEDLPKTANDEEGADASHSDHLIHLFRQDLAAQKFVLTSIPEVALKIRQLMQESEIALEDVAAILSNDPVIVTKIIRAANSTFFLGYERCNTVTEAVVRLGLKTTRELVLCFALRDLFAGSSPALRVEMDKAWKHTVYAGAIAAVLARDFGDFSPEEAMLAGILSNIGVLSVFNYLENYPEIYKNPAHLLAAMTEIKSTAGVLVLEKWGFPAQFVDCARDGERWDRGGGSDEPDLCDLVITANWHSYIGLRDLPRLDRVPACKRLLGPSMEPEFAAQFMENARSDINTARALLSG